MSSQEGRFNGLSFVGGCACAPVDPETPPWSSSPRVGWLGGGESSKLGANFNSSTAGRLNTSLPEAVGAEESHSTLLSKQQVPKWGVCNAVSWQAGGQRRLDATCEKRWVGELGDALVRLAGQLGVLGSTTGKWGEAGRCLLRTLWCCYFGTEPGTSPQ